MAPARCPRWSRIDFSWQAPHGRRLNFPDRTMPQLVIELTENTRLSCSQEELLDEANAALLATGQFQEQDIKSRCVTLTTYRQGVEPLDRAFVHGRLSILDGRDVATRKMLGETVCEAIAEAVRPTASGGPVQVTVEVLEMERATYAKKIIGSE
jgi:5-carboxymethyl-2-hydroxymuconate isomerase